jgi:hypothetical protein
MNELQKWIRIWCIVIGLVGLSIALNWYVDYLMTDYTETGEEIHHIRAGTER